LPTQAVFLPLTQHEHAASKARQVFKAVVGWADHPAALVHSGFADEAHPSNAIKDVSHQVLAYTLHGALV
jgi:hypothetical protein